MQVNSQNSSSMAFGNKIRIVEQLNPSGSKIFMAKRGKDVLGYARNTNGDMRATSSFNGNSYETNAKKYYATPLNDLFNNISRRVKILKEKRGYV